MTSTSDSDDISQVLNGIITEARDLRFSASLPSLESGPSEVLESLREVRQRIDRVEELLFRTTRIRARAQRAHQVAEAASEEAWDKSNQQQRFSGVQRGGEFTGPRERYADANLATLAERRAARQAADMVSFASESYECVRLAHRGLDGVRQDHLSILRTIQFESSLER